ncbi:hypothetical protein HANVADRAFT_50915 [Hanseniaspora valbyensis NRRL Y-1626]|uniref:protein kinase C n=1 Tax=Hanseniaspora valbyensis NRRL Y-1626 TaxID=766949 RepID=A0A1B7TJN9_9ASCO|nr:hypothetical protein HANVADRAFT_50915 [Hanseniaspora valbyensis NRRL Y-1626]
MSGNSIQEKDIINKIEREKKIIHGAQQLRSKTSNSLVIQKCVTNIREAQQNIEYLEDSLKKLSLKNDQNKNSDDTVEKQHSLDPFFTQSSPNNKKKYNSATSTLRNISSDTTSSNDNTSIRTRDRSSSVSQEPKFTRLELMKYDCPYLGQKIQVMLQQLEFKLQVETQYLAANEKLTKLYQIDGDQRTSIAAETGVQDSKYRVQLLKKALKKYESLNVLPKLDQIPLNDEEASDENGSQFNRKQLTGTFTLKISSIRDADHLASPTFSRKPDTYITVKIDDVERARTKPSRSDSWNDEFEIYVDKGHEVEITVYDRIGETLTPVGIMWILLADVVEDIRKKKQVKQVQNGWAVAQDVIGSNNNSNSNVNKLGYNTDTSTSSIYNSQTDLTLINTQQLHQTENYEDSNILSQAWLSLEPTGQILLSFGFNKQQTSKKKFIGGLDRHGAIIKRQEDVFEQHGHHFVQKNFYNIMCCAYCGDFLRYTGFQCLDCKFLCHKKCYKQVVTKCIAKPSSETDLDEHQLNHRIPHRFDAVSNKGTKWCCHCGYILPWGRKNVKKCTECGIMCHQNCSHLVPDFCGMDMETANKILTTIKNTKVTKNKQKIVSSSGHAISSSTRYNSSNQKQQSANSVDMYSGPSMNINPSSSSYSSSDTYVSDNGSGRKTSDLKPISALRAPSIKRPPPSMPPINQILGNSSSNSCLPSSASRVPASQQFLQQQQHKQQVQVTIPDIQDRSYELFDDPDIKRFADEGYKMNLNDNNNNNIINNNVPVLDSLSEHSPEEQDKNMSHASSLSPTKQRTPEMNNVKYETNSPRGNNVTKDHTSIIEEKLSTVEEVATTPYVSSKVQPTKAGKKKKISLDDFMLLKVLGKGNFGKVLLAQSKNSDQLCAIKVLKKEQLLKNNDMESVKAEKKVFLLATQAKHPFLTNLYCSFQTENRIYFAMEFIGGGDLMWHVQNHRLSVKKAKFFAAEVLLALKYFHDHGVIYRDLKLENILLTPEGHIKLADYGLCKDEMWYGCKTSTFCGTPEFIAPEILKEQQYTKSVDWWAFGVLLYQMLLCQSPFSGEDEDEVFNAILTDEPLYPIDMAGDIVQIFQGLLTKDPENRLGAGPDDALEIMREPFFRNINFDDILSLRIRPPFIPQLNGPGDTQYFEEEYTSAPPTLTPVNSILNSSMQEQFRGFSFIPEDSHL